MNLDITCISMNPSQQGFWDGEGTEWRFWPACDYPATQKQIVEANKIRFWVETEGLGSPLVLIHAGPGIDHRVFHPEMSRLAQGHQLIYYDLRGHYMSSEPADPTDYGLEQDARDLEALRQAMALQHIDVLGFSYGGAVALKYASLFPEHLSHLIVCSTPVGMTIEESKRHAQSHPLSQAIAQAKDPQERKELFWRLYFHKPLRPECLRYQELVQQAYDTGKNRRLLAGYNANNKLEREWDGLMQEPPRIEVPVLFIFGRHDYLISLERAHRWVAHLKQAEIAIFEESSHHPFIDEPEAVAQLVSAFLNTKCARAINTGR